MEDITEDRQLRYFDLDELTFDPENPRLPSHQKGATTNATLEWLLDRANLLELMYSIGQQGYFAGEPLLVTPNRDGKLKVVEGNRRYGACLLLSQPDLATTKVRAVAAASEQAEFKPDRLPALVFQNESDVLGMLGYRHITGIQEWGPLAKARYLERLWVSDEGPDDFYARLRHFARRIGSKSDYVARLLTALALYKVISERRFFGIPGLTESTLSFSILVLAMNRPAVANFIGLEDGQDFELQGLDERELEQLTRWFFERIHTGTTVLMESRNMTSLVEVLENDAALAALRVPGTTLADAAKRGRLRYQTLRGLLDDCLDTLVRAEQLIASGAVEPAYSDLTALDLFESRIARLRTLAVSKIS